MKMSNWPQKMLLYFAVVITLTGCQEASMKSDQPADIKSPPNIIFLIADDWSYPHAGAYGDQIVRTPTFDRLATEGALFDNAYCAAPSCSPSRASILTSRYPHQLESAGNLWSILPNKFANWVSILKDQGYHTGKSRKGWGPGDYKSGGYMHNPAGKDYLDFDAFLADRKEGQPFFYWFGSSDPHRTYKTNSGALTGMDLNSVKVPGFLPDLPCVRNDILDYYYEIERFDRESGTILSTLKKLDLMENTLVIMTSDNGMPFPRAKATVYDYGTRMPLAMYWKDKIDSIDKVGEFVNFIDFGPTILEAAGIRAPDSFSGSSFMELFDQHQQPQKERDMVFLERERHANVRKGNLSYPVRAVRTNEFLYIRNFEPDRWPGGDPSVHQAVGQYGDVDNSITKFLILQMEDSPRDKDYFKLAFEKRPAEELYLLAADPYNLKNEAMNPAYAATMEKMRTTLTEWMKESNDIRAIDPNSSYWDEVQYTPTYQFEDYDIGEKIASYKMLVRDGGGYKEISCIP